MGARKARFPRKLLNRVRRPKAGRGRHLIGPELDFRIGGVPEVGRHSQAGLNKRGDPEYDDRDEHVARVSASVLGRFDCSLCRPDLSLSYGLTLEVLAADKLQLGYPGTLLALCRPAY